MACKNHYTPPPCCGDLFIDTTQINTRNVAQPGITGPTGATGEQGEIGPTGPTGANGLTPILTIGTVTTGLPGTQASAQITGTAPTFVLDLTIPQGPTGPAAPTV